MNRYRVSVDSPEMTQAHARLLIYADGEEEAKLVGAARTLLTEIAAGSEGIAARIRKDMSKLDLAITETAGFTEVQLLAEDEDKAVESVKDRLAEQQDEVDQLERRLVGAHRRREALVAKLREADVPEDEIRTLVRVYPRSEA